jgi:hypothetical protein
VLSTALHDAAVVGPDLIGDTAVILAKERIVPDVIDNISDKAAFKVGIVHCMQTAGRIVDSKPAEAGQYCTRAI